jgi:uncharacterized protein YodC (DUF2158 family)
MSQEKQLAKGDVVRLKSGGPKMTISSISTGTSPRAFCNWFDHANTLQSVGFEVSSLILADKFD